MTQTQISWLRDLVLLFIAIGLFFCIGLGARPYLTPSEARYIEIPRQMLVTHDWLTPRINGVPYFEKPPLFYWMQAVTMGLFGMGEFAGRMATAKLATEICLLTYALGRMLYGRLSGLIAAGVLASCVMGYGLSRVAMVDMPVSLFLTATLGCFLAAQHINHAKARRWLYLLMYVAAALAVMDKGLIGIVIPGIVIGTWILATKNWRLLAEVRLIPGLIIFLIITVPWHWLMASEHPDFLQFYFINEHFTRYINDSHKRVEPWWFFAAITLAGLLPWTGLLPSAVRHIKLWRVSMAEPSKLFLLLWIVLPLVFFSTSHSKLAPYIMPIFPPLAMIIGRYLADVWQGTVPDKALRWSNIFVISLFSAAILAYHFMPINDADRKIDIGGSITLSMLMPVIVAMAILACVTVRKSLPRLMIGAVLLLGMTLDITANYAVAQIDRASVKPLLATIKDGPKPDDMVVAYRSYFQDLPIYLNRNITVVGYYGEMEFGVTNYPETKEWMIDTKEFWQRCADHPGRIFVFMKKTTLDGLKMPAACPLHVTAEYGKTVLLEKD